MTRDATQLARWAAAAIASNPGLDDDGLIAILRAAGHPHPARALAMARGATTSEPPLALSAEDGAAPLPDVQTIVDGLVRNHRARLPIKARTVPLTLTPGRAQVQIDLAVQIGDRWLLEQTIGLAATIPSATSSGLDTLVGGVLHVLLASLEDRALVPRVLS